MSEKKCSIEGCEGKGQLDKNGTRYFKKGYCQKHYMRLITHENPLYVKKVHGDNRVSNPLNSILHGIRNRCYNKNEPAYSMYGGRGIKVCDEWMGSHGFTRFLDDMGERPSKDHSIDRIDVNGNYCKENCKWATWHDQQSNRRNNNENVGVSYDKSRNKWKANLKIRNKLYQKRLITEQEAIDYRKYLEKTYLNK